MAVRRHTRALARGLSSSGVSGALLVSRSVATRACAASIACRAVAVPAYGAPPRVAAVAVAAPRPHEVTVRVRAASISPIDLAMQRGYGRGSLERARSAPFPLVLGRDCCGTVARVGQAVWDLQAGDKVIVATSPLSAGCHAEYVNVAASDLCPAPAALTDAEAAALPYAGLTALSAIRCFAAVQPGQTVMVVGAGGPVGGIAVALLKDMGCTVVAVVTPRHVDRARALGADVVVEAPRAEVAPDRAAAALVGAPECDVVLNASGARWLERAAVESVLRPGGRVVALNGDLVRLLDEASDADAALPALAGGAVRAASALALQKWDVFAAKGARFSWAYFAASGSRLHELADLAERAAQSAAPLSRVDAVFPMDQAAAAFARAAEGDVSGRVVLDFKDRE